MKRFVLACVLATSLAPAAATVIGHMAPPPSLTVDRLSALPPAQRSTWAEYIARSTAAMARDKAALATERQGLATIPAPPPEGKIKTMPLDRDPAWYAGDAARAIADNIVSFQTPTGGWQATFNREVPGSSPGGPTIDAFRGHLPGPRSVHKPQHPPIAHCAVAL